MTGPISFGSVPSPQLVQRQRPTDDTNDVLQLLLAIKQGREQLAVRREELELERQRTEASVAASTENAAASREERKRAQAAFEQAQRVMDASDLVAGELTGALSQPGGLTPEKLGALRVRLIQSNKQLAGEINAAFDAQVGGIHQTLTNMAQARSEAVRADLAEGTKAAQLEAGLLAPDVAKAQLDAALAQKRLADLNLHFDPDRVNSAVRMSQTGRLPWGTTRKAFGLGPSSVPDDYVFPPTEGAGGGAEMQRLSGFAAAMDVANQTLSGLKDAGLSDAAFLQLTTGSALVELMTNRMISDEQKQAISAYALYMQPLNRLMAGGNASDRDQAIARRSIVEKRTDGPKTREQKRLLRAILPIALKPYVEGDSDPAIALNTIVEQAKAQGVSMELLAPFVNMANRAKRTGAALRNTQSRTAAPRDATGGTGGTITSQFYRPAP